MSSPNEVPIRRTYGKLLLLTYSLFLLSCFCLCLGLPTHFFDLIPVSDAAQIAKPYAEANGFPMKGYLGIITFQPNWLGRCEVVLEWYDHRDKPPKRHVLLYLTRSWRFGSWKVKEMKVEEIDSKVS